MTHDNPMPPRADDGPHGAAAASADPMAPDRRCRAFARSTGERCQHLAMVDQKVCRHHGGASPQARAAAAQRKAQAEATALLELIWDPRAAPVTDPVGSLQALAGKLQHAADVLGARLEGEELDGSTAVAWIRVLAELRRALTGMEKLDLQSKFITLEQERANVVTAAFLAALEVGGLLPDQRVLMVERFIVGLKPIAPAELVAGEVVE